MGKTLEDDIQTNMDTINNALDLLVANRPFADINNNSMVEGFDENVREDFKFGKSFKKTTKSVSKGTSKAVKTVDKGTKKAVDSAKKGVEKGMDAAMKGLDMGLGAIMSAIKQIMSFIKGIEDFFNNIKKAFTFNEEKALAILLTTVVPFVGQIAGRIIMLGGSLDQPWLLLFGIPPLTLIPALAMMFGLVKPIKGGEPWDVFVILPITVNAILPFLLDKIPFIDDEDSIKNGIVMVALIATFVGVYTKKADMICKGNGPQFNRIAFDSLIAYISFLVMTVALPFMPYIGAVFSIAKEMIPGGDTVISSIGIFVIYVFSNMINGSFGSYCKDKISDDTLLNLFIVALALTFFPNE
jgi:hypothetical protein